MALHLIKLAVGCPDIASLQERQNEQKAREKRLFHITRMIPKRQEELFAGGSLYWVIKHRVRVRQKLLGLEEFRSDDGVKRCRLLLAPQLIEVVVRRRRPFQGWRYLAADDAPHDKAGQEDAMLASLDTKNNKSNELPEEIEDILNDIGVV